MVLVVIPVAAAHAQPTFRAGPPVAVLNDEFTRISGVREISGDRVIVGDAREKRVVVGRWSDGATRQLGRVGDGPTEYRSVFQLMASGGDSTYVLDGQAHRWRLLVGETFGRAPEPERAVRLTTYEPPLRGIDGRGRFLVMLPTSWRVFDSDTVWLATAQLDDALVDTIMRLRGRGSERTRVARVEGGSTGYYLLHNPFGIEEQALLFYDGWLAVAHLSPFRVDWRMPTGEWVRGDPLVSGRQRVTEAEKRFAILREWPGFTEPLPTAAEFPAWPDHIPPYLNDGLLALPDGRLAIARTPTVAEPDPMYSIIDRSGREVARLVVQPRQRIAAFGARHFYVITKDEFDVERVSRHAMPAF